MKSYKPNTPFNIRYALLTPKTKKVKGVATKTFEETMQFNGSFRDKALDFSGSFGTFGGKDATLDGVRTVVNDTTIDTWYHPDIKANCRVKDLATGEVYEIIGTVNNISRMNQYIRMKVQNVGEQP